VPWTAQSLHKHNLRRSLRKDQTRTCPLDFCTKSPTLQARATVGVSSKIPISIHWGPRRFESGTDYAQIFIIADGDEFDNMQTEVYGNNAWDGAPPSVPEKITKKLNTEQRPRVRCWYITKLDGKGLSEGYRSIQKSLINLARDSGFGMRFARLSDVPGIRKRPN
jgi:hypothetical protein